MFSCETDNTITSLDAPLGLTIVDETITWRSVENATSYIININGKEYFTTTTSFNLPSKSYGDFLVFVIAKNGTIISSPSTSISFTINIYLDTPQNLRIDEALIKWNSVNNANEYIININGVDFATPNTYYIFNANIDQEIKVKARNNLLSYVIDSPYCQSLSYQVPPLPLTQLATPLNVKIIGNLITFDLVPNANVYLVYIDGVYFKSFTTNNIIVDSEFVYTNDSFFQIRARGTGYLDSNLSLPVLFVPPLEKLSTPINLAFVSPTIAFSAVINATHYELFIDGIYIETFTSTSINITSYLYLLQPESYFQIKAKAVGFEESNLSTIKYFFPFNLGKVTNIVISGNNVTFTLVNNALSYEVYIDGVLKFTVSTNSLVLSGINTSTAIFLEIKALAPDYVPSMSDRIYFNYSEIKSESDLRNMQATTNYYITKDIALTSPWIPLPYKGKLDGNLHIISNISIAGDPENVGLFSILDGANVSRLTLSGTFNLNQNVNAPKVGSLAGTIVNSVVSYVTSNIDINATCNNGIGYLGGIVGMINSSTITYSVYNGKIVDAYYITGGFMGTSNNSSTALSIKYCGVNSQISALGGEQVILGGFVGYIINNRALIEESYAKITLLGSSYVGGFVGYLGSANFKNCYAKGSLNATNTLIVHAGGFSGRTEGYNNTVNSCVALVVVVCALSTSNHLKGSFVGYTVSGTWTNIYSACYYDTTLNTFGAKGNSSGNTNGVNGLSTQSAMMSGLNNTIWVLSNSILRLIWELSF